MQRIKKLFTGAHRGVRIRKSVECECSSGNAQKALVQNNFVWAKEIHFLSGQAQYWAGVGEVVSGISQAEVDLSQVSEYKYIIYQAIVKA